MYTVFGAGSVGTVLAAMLAEAGVAVSIAGRRAVSTLRAEGNDETIRANVPVVTEPRGTLVFCVHEGDLPPLAARWPEHRKIAFVNGVAEVPGVDAAIWRMTCTLDEPGVARFTARGRAIVTDADFGADLRRAGLDVGVAEDITPDRWLKLLVNLASAAHALVPRAEHAQPEFGEAKAMLLEEAHALFLQHGIDARSCDGRDASPTEEIARQRVARHYPRAVHNGTWRTLHRGRPPKLHFQETVLSLGDAPKNAAMLVLLKAATGPECYSAAEVFRAIRDA